MSLLKSLNITDELMAKYSPLGQLTPKYRAQVLKNSQVVTFEAGEQVFEKQHALESLYFLLKGKIKVKTGIFSSETLDASKAESKYPINSKVPSGTSAKALKSGHMILIDEELLDRALGWSMAEKDKLSSPQSTPDDIPVVNAPKTEENIPTVEEPQGFDEEHFTWITSLMEFPLFFNLPPSNMETLLHTFTKVSVKEGDKIIKEGDEGDYFYLLMEGSARVVISGDESRPIHLKRGSYFGEEALISDTVRSATVIMNEDGLLARLDKASFHSLLNDPLVKHVTRAEYQQETQAKESCELLDIRSFSEFEFTPLPKCLHIPLSELRQKLPSMDKSVTYYLTEEGGHRSDVAAHILSQNSFSAKVIRD